MSCVLLCPTPGLACAVILRETREKPLEGSLPNLIVDFSRSFLLQDRVAAHPKGVVDSTDAKTLAEKGKVSLRGPVDLRKEKKTKTVLTIIFSFSKKTVFSIF